MDDSSYERTASTGVQCITIDLGKEYDLEEIAVWHIYVNGFKFTNSSTSVAGNDNNFKTIRTGDYAETSTGMHIKATK